MAPGVPRLGPVKTINKTQPVPAWEISKVVHGDDSVDAHDKVLDVGKWYGIYGSRGGYQEYCEVCPDSLRLFTGHGTACQFRITRGSVGSKQIRLPKEGPKVLFRSGMTAWEKVKKVGKVVCD